MMAPPRYATARTPERKTLGPVAAKVAKLLGFTLMPWQKLVLDVALELGEDGKLVYRDVTVSTPRQQGKTSLLLALWATRCSLWPAQTVRYAAQSGQHARLKLTESWLPVLEASPLGSHVKVRLQNGSEGVTFPNGSRLGLVATNATAGHGDVCDLILLDEVFSYQDGRLEQGLRPTTATRSQPQFWVTSTAGTPDRSPYLLEKVERGRTAVGQGLNHSLAFFEWAADPAADPGDPATWESCMPALDVTISHEAVRAAYESMARREFERAFCNRWTLTMGDALIDLDHWNGLAEPDAAKPAWVALGIDCAPKGRSAAIAACGESDGVLYVSILEHGPGVDWVIPALQRLTADEQRYVLCDEKACASILGELKATAGVDHVVALTPSTVPAACAFFLRVVNERRIRHRAESELAVAIDAAGTRQLGDGWALSRTRSGADITPLCAAVFAADFFRGGFTT